MRRNTITKRKANCKQRKEWNVKCDEDGARDPYLLPNQISKPDEHCVQKFYANINLTLFQ